MVQHRYSRVPPTSPRAALVSHAAEGASQDAACSIFACPLNCIANRGLCGSSAVALVCYQLRESVLRIRRLAASPVAESRRSWTSLLYPIAIAC